jgi:pSer/pThr/pTyr-binding forkhead associated (FHA) protein
LHCMIEVIEKHSETLCILTDDGSISESGEASTNGTFYNETRLTRYDKVYLNHGDKVRLGRTEFVFRIEY